MDLKEHAYHLGALLANLQSLEFALRSFLQQRPGGGSLGVAYGEDIYSVRVGCNVPESAFTNYDSLGTLISKYNTIAATEGHVQIDGSLVEIRDALAHGRISASAGSGVLRLLKFAKPRAGTVKVTFNAPLTKEWFTEHKNRAREAMFLVVENLNPPGTFSAPA